MFDKAHWFCYTLSNGAVNHVSNSCECSGVNGGALQLHGVTTSHTMGGSVSILHVTSESAPVTCAAAEHALKLKVICMVKSLSP